MALSRTGADTTASGTGNLSWTHTPAVAPHAVIVVVIQEYDGVGNATDQVSGVTYGGQAMVEATGSPLLSTGASEPGALYCYTLLSSIPTGAQTVAVTVSGSQDKAAAAITLIADSEVIEIEDTSTGDDLGANPSVDLTTGVGVETFVVGICKASAAAVGNIAAGTDYTNIFEQDFGPDVGSAIYRTSNASGGTVTVDWVVGAGNSIFAIALKEVAAAGGTIAPMAMHQYRLRRVA